GAIIRSELALRYGEVVRFRVQPVDPVDAFRGRYVALRFGINRAVVPDGLVVPREGWVFVPLVENDEGFAELGVVSLARPATGPYLRLRSGPEFTDDENRRVVSVTLPFGRLYMDEELAPETERAMWRRGRREAFVTVFVRDGFGVMEELFVEDLPVREWLAQGGADRPLPTPTPVP
ncbi:MAG: GDYXXLXY domain-containing protein, partial [Thermoanaerobaculales bacterium]